MKTRTFLLVEAALYMSFLFAGPYTVFLKYASILLCAAYAWTGERPIAIALALTAVADLFLLVLGKYLELGVCLFLAVQALYALHIRRDTRGTLCARIAAPLLLWAALWAMHMATALNLLAGAYFPQLLCNMALAWRKDKVLAAGLTLFVGCDVCVGLWNLADVAGAGMWAFYLPSQVLIAISGRKAQGHQ